MLCSIINDKTLVLCFVLFQIRRCNIKLYYSAHKRTQNSSTYGWRGFWQTNRSACGQRRIDALLDFWRGARQVRRRLRRRPVRLCVGYGVGSTQKYKLGFTRAVWNGRKPGSTEALALKAPLFTWSVKSFSCSSADHALAQVRPHQIFTRKLSKNETAFWSQSRALHSIIGIAFIFFFFSADDFKAVYDITAERSYNKLGLSIIVYLCGWCKYL